MVKVPDLKNYPRLREFLIGKNDKYILDKDRNVIPANLFEWGEFLESAKGSRRVGRDKVDGCIVSTVFIGFDHNWEGLLMPGEHKPHIFETMVFDGDGEEEGYCDRYSTWAEAEEGHQKAIQWVKEGLKPCNE